MSEAGESANDPDDGDVDRSHLRDVADGCGCADVWEYLSAHRDGDPEDEDDADEG